MRSEVAPLRDIGSKPHQGFDDTLVALRFVQRWSNPPPLAFAVWMVVNFALTSDHAVQPAALGDALLARAPRLCPSDTLAA